MKDAGEAGRFAGVVFAEGPGQSGKPSAKRDPSVVTRMTRSDGSGLGFVCFEEPIREPVGDLELEGKLLCGPLAP
jgi:hypothetical protein